MCTITVKDILLRFHGAYQNSGEDTIFGVTCKPIRKERCLSWALLGIDLPVDMPKQTFSPPLRSIFDDQEEIGEEYVDLENDVLTTEFKEKVRIMYSIAHRDLLERIVVRNSKTWPIILFLSTLRLVHAGHKDQLVRLIETNWFEHHDRGKYMAVYFYLRYFYHGKNKRIQYRKVYAKILKSKSKLVGCEAVKAARECEQDEILEWFASIGCRVNGDYCVRHDPDEL